MRIAEANGAEHAWSVRSPYANDRSSYANVRSSYAIDATPAHDIDTLLLKNVKLMLCVPYQFAHTNQI